MKDNTEALIADPMVARIQANPKYLELRRKRNALGGGLTVAMLVVYYGYISLIAFNKPFLAQPIGSGVTSLGIPLAAAVIIFTVAITAFYVNKANSEFDDVNAQILREATR